MSPYCSHCGNRTDRKPYMFNLDKANENVHDLMQRIWESLDSSLFTLQNHKDVARMNEMMHSLIRDGYNVEIILRKKGRF